MCSKNAKGSLLRDYTEESNILIKSNCNNNIQLSNDAS